MPQDIIQWVMQGGVPALALVLLYLFTKHHLATLEEHKKLEKAASDDRAKLEDKYSVKVEELLKDQLKLVPALTESLAENTNALEAVKELLEETNKTLAIVRDYLEKK